jgi:hypothetical protein
LQINGAASSIGANICSSGQQAAAGVGYKASDLPIAKLTGLTRLSAAATAADQDAAKLTGTHAAAAEPREGVAAADDISTGKQTVAAFPDSQASHKPQEVQAQPKHVKFSTGSKSIDALASGSGPVFAEDAATDAVSPFEMHGAAYGDLLQVQQCSFSEWQIGTVQTGMICDVSVLAVYSRLKAVSSCTCQCVL